MDNEAKRAPHDLGGVSKFMCDAVNIEPHALTAFDREVDAISGVLRAKQLMSVDEMRRGIEAIPEADYLRLISIFLPAISPPAPGLGLANRT